MRAQEQKRATKEAEKVPQGGLWRTNGKLDAFRAEVAQWAAGQIHFRFILGGIS